MSANATDNNTTATDITPPNWWKKSSYAYTDTNKILTHFEGMISYSKSEGNENDKDLLVKLSAKVRKKHLGVSFTYSRKDSNHKLYLDKSDTNPTNIVKDVYSAVTRVGYDINKNFYVIGGYENARNIEFEIYNQTTRYIGGGYQTYYKSHRLNIMGAIGDEDISFGTYPQLPSGKSNGFYYNLTYGYTTSTKIDFSINYSHFVANMKNRDTGKLTAQLSIPIFDHVSIVAGYIDDYMEAQTTVNRYVNDKTFYTAIKFEF